MAKKKNKIKNVLETFEGRVGMGPKATKKEAPKAAKQGARKKAKTATASETTKGTKKKAK